MTAVASFATPELAESLQRLLRLAQGAIPFDRSAIHLIQEKALVTHAVFPRPASPLREMTVGSVRSLEEGVHGYIASTGQSFLSPDLSTERRFRPTRADAEREQGRSFLGVPLRSNDAIIGVLELIAGTPEVFLPQHLELAEVVGEQAAAAIIGATLAHHRKHLARMARALNGALELRSVGQLVLDELPHLVRFDNATISLLNDSRLEFVAVRGEHAPREGEFIPLSDLALSSEVIATRQPLLVSNAGEEAWQRLERWRHFQCWLGAPLIANDRVIGVLSCDRRDVNGYDERDRMLLASCADHAALALENARLYSNTRAHNQALSERNDQLAALLDAAESAIVMSDGQGVVVHVNSVFCRVFQLSRDEMIRAPIEEVNEAMAPHFRDSNAFRERSAWLREHPRVVARDNLTTAGPMPRLFQRYSAPVYGSAGPAVTPGRIDVYTDVTESRRLEEQMRQYLDDMMTLHRIGILMGSEHELTELLNLICEQAVSLVDADAATVALLDEASPDRVTFPVVYGLDPVMAGRIETIEYSLAGEAITQRAPVLVPSTETVAEDLVMLRQQWEMESCASIPLEAHDRAIGALVVFRRGPERFDEHGVQLLQIFAAQAAVTLDNTRLLRVVQTRRAELEELTTSINQNRSNLNAILQSMADGVIALNNQQEIIFVNQPLFDLFEIEQTRQSWVGKPISTLLPRFGPVAALLTDEILDSEEAMRVAIEIPGSRHAIELLHTPIADEEGRRVGFLLLFHDITELRANERMKDELISVLSHELRTPLTSILGYSKLLVDRPEAPASKRTRWAGHILQKSRLLNRLVNEVLDLSRVNIQRLDLRVEPGDLALLVNRVVDEQRLLLDGHHTVDVVLDGDLSSLLMDSDRIEQLLANLLTNAFKYSPEGGRVAVRVCRRDKEVQIEVSDEGMGIPEEFHERIFEPFFRVDNSTTRNVYGTGLGLPLCRGIARAHGGDVSLESIVGEGTTFRVNLPVR